jgi:capsular polysaccharide biosynthesis protein
VGDQRRQLRVTRPIRFDDLTIVSGPQRSTFDFGAWDARGVARRFLRASGRLINLDGFYFDTRGYDPNNIAHLLTDIIPACLLVRETLGESAAFIFRRLLPQFRELLAVVGIDPICTYRPVRGNRVELYGSRELAQYPIKTYVPDCPAYDLIGTEYAPFLDPYPADGARKLFISRRGPRALVNEGEVRALLESRGFRTAYFEDLPIADQISAILSADEIVCVHGAAMGYLCLKDRLGRVVELLPPNVYHNLFPIAVGHKVGHYAQLIPSFDEDVQFSGWEAILRAKQSPFAVDMNQLRSAVGD